MNDKNDIKDMSGYISKMDITIPDKLFWTQYVTHPVSQLIDIGCASGKLLSAFHSISPDTELIGIEESKEMKRQLFGSFDCRETPFIKLWAKTTGLTGGYSPGNVTRGFTAARTP